MLHYQDEQGILHSAPESPLSCGQFGCCVWGTSPLLVSIHSHWVDAEWCLNFFLMISLSVHSGDENNVLSESRESPGLAE